MRRCLPSTALQEGKKGSSNRLATTKPVSYCIRIVLLGTVTCSDETSSELLSSAREDSLMTARERGRGCGTLGVMVGCGGVFSRLKKRCVKGVTMLVLSVLRFIINLDFNFF